MKFLSHIYSYMIYKITKLQTQKNLNKGNMTKKLDLTQSFQKLLTLLSSFWDTLGNVMS
jgi:flagellin-specific chaperone FliS